MSSTLLLSEGPAFVHAEDLEAIKASVLTDPFLFAKVVCGQRDLSARSHRPLMYMAAGLTDKLIDILNNPAERSYVVQKIRNEIRHRQGVDWNTDDGWLALDRLLRFNNIRVFRGAGKSSAITHPLPLWMATKDPNVSIAIISNVEDKAIDFCKQIRSTILSEGYRSLFPERIPDDLKDLTESQLKLKGRTRADKEPTIHAFGYKGGITGYHYDVFFVDDLVGKENRSSVLLADARSFLADLTNLENPGFRYHIRRNHVGTRWDDDDDDSVLRDTHGCVSVSIPCEHHDEPPDDIFTPGTPTMPEWADGAKILEWKHKDTASEEGAISFRANRWLDPTLAGGRIFPAALVDEAVWRRVEGKEPGRWFLAIPKIDEATRKKVLDENGNQAWEIIDPNALFLAFGWDQSFAEDGDQWSIATLGQDSKGRIFVLAARRGNGYGAMLDSSLYLDSIFHPKKIGLEGGSMQKTTHWWMQRDAKFAKFQGRLVEVPPSQKGKEHRIRNMVAEPMRCRQMYLPPDQEYEFIRTQMKKYKPGKKADDNVIDSIAIGAVALSRPANSDDVKKTMDRLSARYRQRVDPDTGIYIGY